jgi:hypothetical protein
MGNLYNVEQKVNSVKVANTFQGSVQGLDQWNREVRKQIMEKLRGYAPDQIEKIIKNTFGNLGKV